MCVSVPHDFLQTRSCFLQTFISVLQKKKGKEMLVEGINGWMDE